MSLLKKIFPCVAMIFCATVAMASEGGHDGVSTTSAPLVDSIPWLTNSILTTWLVALLLVFLLRRAIGKPQLVPGKGQALVEGIMDMFREVLEPIVGKKAFPATYPLLVCIFFFVLSQNWASLLPGIGTIGIYGADGSFTPFFRPFGADMNGTFSLALVSFGAWLILIFRFAGVKGVLHEWFGNKADKREVPAAIYYLLTPIFAAVGIIELISIVFRPISLSFRLFGNVLGGETLLHSTSYFFGFYFLELIVGVVQALVFMMLTAVYIGLVTAHEDENGHAPENVPAK